MGISLKNGLKFIFIYLIFNTLTLNSSAQSDTIITIINDSLNPIEIRQNWIDSVFNSLSDDEKIGQLFMIRAHSNKSREYHLNVKKQIEQYKVGGVCFFQGGPGRQIALVNEYNLASDIPLFVAIDGEWGVGMRLDSVIDFPHQMTLGATNDPKLIYKIGLAFGKQCKSVGVNINFAPVADVNSNPDNPVINYRSFGENPQRTAEFSWQIAHGMQDENVYACAKHFPGHGDTKSDSHKTLPTVKGNTKLLDSLHLFPFKYLSEKGIKSVMVAHLFVPAYDTTAGRASSLSPKIVNGLLFDSLNFKGLAITDALEMKGVSSYFEPGEIELRALMAGNDILLMPPNIDKAIAKIKEAVSTGIIEKEYLDNKIKKILFAKYDLGLNQKKVVDSKTYKTVLNSEENKSLILRSYKEAMTLVINKNDIIPLTSGGSKTMAVVSIGVSESNQFSNNIKKHHKISTFSLPNKPSLSQAQNLADKLKKYDLVIVNVMNTNNSAQNNYGISQTSVDFVNLICQSTKVILVVSANPYAAGRFIEQCESEAVMITYEDNSLTREIAANSLFGADPISGKLPVSISSKYREGHGIKTKKTILGTSTPEETGFQSEKLNRIDSIIKDGIIQGAYPGARVLIAKKGQIFYNKSFGNLTYEGDDSVEENTIYDLASVTKTMATTLAVMKLVEEKKLDIDLRLMDYLPELKGTNKGGIYIRELLAHQARLEPWIPLYLKIIPEQQIDTNVLSRSPKERYSKRVSESLYILDSYSDSMILEITNSKLLPQNKYKYSDLGMYYMKAIIERITNTTLDKYCDSVFYNELNLSYTAFNPLNRFDISMIAPTEMDKYFRNELIRGYVHDQGAAMLGGVGGHAGLFSTADDMAILCQMLLQNGKYGNISYIDSTVLEDFTRRQFPLNHNRRGLGFDKPLPLNQSGGPTCPLVSSKSYGHSGFTGTYFWIDPEYDLIYIFLSNRVYPSAENRKLITLGIRTKIQEEIYKQMGVKI